MLASQGKYVEVVTHQFEAGALMEPITHLATMRRVNGLGIRIRTGTWLKEVGEGFAVLYDITTSKEERGAGQRGLACSILPEPSWRPPARGPVIRVPSAC
jgi:hypothetical protein